MRLRGIGLLLVMVGVWCGELQAQVAAPRIDAIDPPGWWAGMPKPMLLVRGEGLTGATVEVSDRKLGVERVAVSENGHWLQVWLARSPQKAETVAVRVTTPKGKTEARYAFAPRRAAGDGFAGFSSKDVLYLIMTDRFADGDSSNDGVEGRSSAASAEAAAERKKSRGWHGGDLRGIEQHLDYLQGLGVTTVWMTPVYSNQGEKDSYHGYGATDLYAVDPHYGTLEDLRALGKALHARGMKLVLDTVPNHVGPKHPWVDDEPTPEWFHGTKANHHRAVGEFQPLVDPHAPWRDQEDILQGWFANTLPDMNTEEPAVKQYLIQNAVWWVEQTGADGLRIDTFPYVGRLFWHEFHATLHGLYPRLTTVGEVYNGDATIVSAFAGGSVRGDLNGSIDTGLDTPFDFPTQFAIRDVLLKDAPMRKLADTLRMDALYPHPERLVPFFGNHDMARFLSEPGATAAKERLAYALVLTMRGMPEIYSGDEIAMEGGADPDNRREFPGGFSGSVASAFDAGTRTPEQAAMFDWVKRLLTMRAASAALSAGDEQIVAADASAIAYVRGTRLGEGCTAGVGERMLVVVNKGTATKTMEIDAGKTALEGCAAGEALLGEPGGISMSGGKVVVRVGAESAVAVRLK